MYYQPQRGYAGTRQGTVVHIVYQAPPLEDIATKPYHQYYCPHLNGSSSYSRARACLRICVFSAFRLRPHLGDSV